MSAPLDTKAADEAAANLDANLRDLLIDVPYSDEHAKLRCHPSEVDDLVRRGVVLAPPKPVSPPTGNRHQRRAAAAGKVKR